MVAPNLLSTTARVSRGIPHGTPHWTCPPRLQSPQVRRWLEELARQHAADAYLEYLTRRHWAPAPKLGAAA